MSNEIPVKKEEPVTEPAQPSAPQPSMIESALASAERIEKAVSEMKEQNDRADKRFALQQLGGKSEAGKPAEEKKEETAKEYAARVMRNDVETK